MPLLVFPGGYGGMVHCDGGQVSLSCCIRRDWLSRIRAPTSASAGEAVLDHLTDSCLGVRRALAGARRDRSWLAAGPIRPGIRVGQWQGLFRVGNAAGEAHPIVAEGISMAMQSAWLLARRLIAWRKQSGRAASIHGVAADYGSAWRRNFAPRVYVSEMLAQWALRPTAVSTVLPLLRRFPTLLTWGARWSGKATRAAAF
jgi:flavin-dependent dehydrogenase